jgi:predicted phage baseplate assembly protein
VRFGDGTTGRRLPTGTGNVRARLRKGLGDAGNAAAATITVLLQPRPGLRGVTNPLAAFGGTGPEPAARVRQNAPTTVVTLGRAVSLRDYEMLALSYRGGVAKVRAAWAEFGARRGVALTIAGAGGKPVDQLIQPLRFYLDERRDPNVPLAIGGATSVPVLVRATVHVLAGWKRSVVKTAADAALGPSPAGTGHLDFAQLQFGRHVFPSELIAVLQGVPGVEWVELRRFTTPAVDHAFGDPDRPEAILIGPGEIAEPTVELSYAGGVSDLEGA